MEQRDLKAKRVWLKAFWGFDPGGDGYLGFTLESDRDRLISEWQPGDLVLIYGAASEETARENRRQALGFLEIDPVPTSDVARSSALAMKRKIDRGYRDRWTYAVPVKRAWRVERRIEVKYVAPDTYDRSAGRVIAKQGKLIRDGEVVRALALPVQAVSVFGEPPVESGGEIERMSDAYRPSRGIHPTFGLRESEIVDGPCCLYMHVFEGDLTSLLGRSSASLSDKIVVKIGYSNDPTRRCGELNLGIPPAAKSRWKEELKSRPFKGASEAKAAEDKLKASFDSSFESLGGEFFLGRREDISSKFISACTAAAFTIKA